MKKIIALSYIGLSLLAWMLVASTPIVVYAADGAPAQLQPAAGGNFDDLSKQKIDKLFTIRGTSKVELNNLKKVSEQVGSTQEGGYADVFAAIVKTISGAAVIMTFVGIVVAGILFVFAQGEESRITKARTILIYIIVGDLIIAASYMIIRGITLIKPLS